MLGRVAAPPDGRRVIALLPNGGYAEYAVAHESMVFPVPDELDDGEALALRSRASPPGTCSTSAKRWGRR